jgi:hypothetical protein
MIMELNKIAILHLFLLGLEDELDNFTLTLNNPSTQAKMLQIEQLQAEVTLYKDAVSDAGNGFSVMSMTRASREILGWSDDEIKQDLLEQRMEKAAATEMENTANVIKHTGTFDEVDKIYGDLEAAAEGEEGGAEGGEGEEGGAAGGGGGGGFGGGGLDFGGEGEEFGAEGGEEGGEEGGFGEEGGEETGGEEAGGEEAGGEAEGFGESIRKAENLITEQKQKYKKKVNKYQNNYFGKLVDSIKPEDKEVINERVKVTDKNMKINETINDMISGIDKILDE